MKCYLPIATAISSAPTATSCNKTVTSVLYLPHFFSFNRNQQWETCFRVVQLIIPQNLCAYIFQTVLSLRNFLQFNNITSQAPSVTISPAPLLSVVILRAITSSSSSSITTPGLWSPSIAAGLTPTLSPVWPTTRGLGLITCKLSSTLTSLYR